MNLDHKELLAHKSPRDFVFVDEFWIADEEWPEYYLQNKVWVFMDEYHADLIGDEDYARIIIHSSPNAGWLYSKRLEDRHKVHDTLAAIDQPVSEKQLKALGFTTWKNYYI